MVNNHSKGIVLRLVTKYICIIIFVVFLMLLFGLIDKNDAYAAEIDSGQFGDSINWILDDEGTLSITGNGKMPSRSSSSSIPWHVYYSSIKNISIGEGITSISGYAFSDCGNALTITMTNDITEIGQNAFYGCAQLADIEIPEGVLSIGESAFYGCSSLTDIDIPKGVVTLEEKVFYGCSNLSTIRFPQDSNVNGIGKSAFYNCAALKDILIPKGISYIYESSFYNCVSLETVDIKGNVNSVGDNAFDNCTSLSLFNVDGSISTIGISVFNRCGNDLLELNWNAISVQEKYTPSVNDDGSVKSFLTGCNAKELRLVGNGVTISSYNAGQHSNPTYYRCSVEKLVIDANNNVNISGFPFKCSELDISGGKISLPSKLFYNNGLLTKVKLQGVCSIGALAFRSCANLTEVEIAGRLTELGWGAFSYCNNLRNISIPEGLVTIYKETFSGCSSLSSIIIPEGVASIEEFAFDNCNNLDSISIPDSVSSIGNSAFNGCSSLTSVTISEGVTVIASSTFSGCSSLNSIIIPEGVTSIEGQAFYNCNNLDSISIPDSVNSIGNSAFSGCSSLSSIIIPEGVTSIEGQTFYNCNNLDSISIPDSVNSIGNSAFYGCSSLTSLNIPDSVSYIGASAFSQCSGLSSITIPGEVDSITGHMFEDCTNLESISFSDVIASIGESAFSGCSKIERLILPRNVTNIGDNAFANCIELEKIELPEGLETIGEYCFSNCDSILYIAIPTSVTTIGKSAFYNCKKLRSVEIPGNVSVITSTLFYGCSNLNSIVLSEGVDSITTDAFYNCNTDLRVYVPESVKQIVNGASSNIGYITVCTMPGAYIADNHPGKWTIEYLCDPPSGEVRHYLEFRSGTIVMKSEEIIELSDYLNTDFDFSECDIQLSDEELFFYDDGQIANFGAGRCVITVSNSDYSTSATIIAQNSDAERIGGLSFKEPIVNLDKGDSHTNAVTLTPENADINSVVWNSSDTSIATVENGLVTGVSNGTTIITAFSKDDNTIRAQYTVNVVVPLSGIIVPSEATSIEKGQSKQLLYYKYPADTTVDDITFASSDPDIVEVDEDGVITAKASGAAEIQISSGDVSATVEVDVFNLLDGISLDVKTAQVKARESLQLNVVYEPEDTTFRDVSWTSSKESVATVDENGIVTAHGKGLTTITATAGKYTAKCTIMCPDIPISEVIIPDSVEIKYGETYNTEIEILPTTTTDDTTVTWASSDDSIFTVSNDGEITPTGIGSATLTASVGEFEETATVVIEKGDPEYDLPEGLSAHCGQKLEDISLPDGFTWEDPEQEVGVVGTNSLGIIYTPDDTDHYNIVSDLQTEVTVEHLFAEQWSSDDVNHWHECVCGEKEDEAIHTYSDWNILTEPTCTAEGERERTCSVCGHVNKESIEAKGHDWYADYKTDIEATCIGAGEKSIHCRVCGIKDADSIVTIEPLGHVYAETIVEPTCSQKGYTLHVCGRCGDTYKDNEVSASGHSFGEWITDEESSCTKEGCKHRECSGCGYIETQNVDKKDHIFSTEYVIDKAPTCTTDGSKSFHCTAEGCSATTGSVVISAEGHKYGDWEEINKVTCTEDGVYERVCDVCGEKETIQVEKIGHIWTKDYFIDKVATLDEDGSMMTHCAVCDAKNEESAILIKKPEFYDLSVTSYTYDGRVKRPTPYISDIEDNEIDNTNYTVSYANNKNAGTATAIVKLKGKYEGEIKMGFIIEKARNPFSIRTKTVTIKQKKVAKAKQTIAVSKAFYMAKAKGKVTFTRKNGNKKIVIYKTGKVIVKKGLKKGTYKVKIRVKDSGNANYKACVKNVTLRVRVVK